MFTGLIERTSRVLRISDEPSLRRLVIAADWTDVKLGESIAINGVCLTATELGFGLVGFDVIPETLSKTNLPLLHEGDEVNVERALRAGDRIDGHFVQGHVDGTARLERIVQDNGEFRLVIAASPSFAPMLVFKGSICVDGVSLTIAAVRGNIFEVALIPTTLKLTTLGSRPLGWPFNLEADIITKTVLRFLETRQT
jgi:riboflavin synthase